MRRKHILVALAVLTIAVVSVGVLAVERYRARADSAASVVAQRQILFLPPEQTVALPALRQATTAHPGEATAWVNLGNYHLRNRNLVAAIDAYQKALAINPNLPHTWSALGEAQIQVGRSDGPAMPVAAKASFTHALALDANDMRSRFYMTMEKDFAGQHDEAIGEWLKMLQTAPMGSDADNAIRAALLASINRNLRLVKIEMERISSLQPRAVKKEVTAG